MERESSEKREPSYPFEQSPYITAVLTVATDELKSVEGVNYMNPEFLLLAAVELDGSPRELDGIGVPSDDVLFALKFLLHPANQEIPPEQREEIKRPASRLTQRSIRILASVYETATEQNRDVSTLDLVKEIWRNGDNYGYKVLKDTGVNLDHLVESGEA